MGWQLLHQACRQVSKWSQEGMPIAVSVNLAAEQLLLRDYKSRRLCLSVSGIDPSLLKLEVTGSLIENQAMRCRCLRASVSAFKFISVTLAPGILLWPIWSAFSVWLLRR